MSIGVLENREKTPISLRNQGCHRGGCALTEPPPLTVVCTKGRGEARGVHPWHETRPAKLRPLHETHHNLWCAPLTVVCFVVSHTTKADSGAAQPFSEPKVQYILEV